MGATQHVRWPCVCVRRRRGKLTHIRINAATVKRCQECGTRRPNIDEQSVSQKVPAINVFRCAQCGKLVKRESNKAWVKSHCDKTGKTVHLQRVEA